MPDESVASKQEDDEDAFLRQRPSKRPRRRADWQRDLQNYGADASRQMVDDFALTQIPWELRVVGDAETKDASYCYPASTDYLTLRVQQNQAFAESKLRAGLSASSNLEAARKAFQDGLDLVPDHPGLLNAMHNLENQEQQEITNSTKKKEVKKAGLKTIHSLQDAVLERNLLQGGVKTSSSGVAATADAQYPLLPLEDEDRIERRRKHQKKKKKRRRKKRRRRRSTSSESDDSSSSDSESSRRQRHRKKRRRRKRRRSAAEDSNITTSDNISDSSSVRAKKRRRRRHVDDTPPNKRRRHRASSSSSFHSDDDSISTVDSRKVARRRRRRRERSRS